MFIGAIIFLVILIFLQLLLSKYSTLWDYTESKKFTLASQTRNLLKSLEHPVQLLYITAQTQNQRTMELLDLYQRFSDQISYEVIDAEKNPEKVQELAPVTLNAVYVKTGGGDSEIPEQHEKVSPVNENNLTNALLKLVRGGNRKLYFTQGHNERSLENSDRQGIAGIEGLLQDEGYQVETVKLFETGEVPDDAVGLIVVQPKTPFLQPEIDALRDYANNAGKLMFLIDPEADSGLDQFLKEEFGVVLQNNYIVDNNPLMQMFGGSAIAPTIAEVGDHPIVNQMGNQVPALPFPMAQSIALETEGLDVEGSPLFKTSNRSFGETNIEQMKQQGTVQKDENDLSGPLNLAVAVSKPVVLNATGETSETDEMLEGDESDESNVEQLEEEPEARVIVFGDSDFINNQNIRSSMDIFLNCVNWLSKQEDLISIRPKDTSGQPVMITQPQGNFVFYTSLFIIPLLMAIFGTVIIAIRHFTRG